VGATISVLTGTYTETLTISDSVTLTGAGVGRTIIDGEKSGTVVTVNEGATVKITGVTIRNGLNSLEGGGIFNAGALTLSNSTVSGNSATGVGGIFNAGTLTVRNSTLSGNRATDGSAGGIFNDATLTVTNSTLSGNRATGVGGIVHGGGIYNDGGTLTLSGSTLSHNSATVGGGIDNIGGTVTLATTILAGNTASRSGPDCAGTLTSDGFNLVGIGNGCGLTNGQNGDQVGTRGRPRTALLGPLSGPSLTMAPQPGSPAIDAVPRTQCASSTDQRGYPRPDEGQQYCDVGAVETDYSVPLPTPTSTYTPMTTQSSSATPTAPTPTTTLSPSTCGRPPHASCPLRGRATLLGQFMVAHTTPSPNARTPRSG
jgi:hypothetical protein